MVQATGHQATHATGLATGVPRSEQLELQLDGLPSRRRAVFLHGLKTFGSGFVPKLGANLLMRVGVPMVATTTPAVLQAIAPERSDDWKANLVVGGALGGVWGALVGAILPTGGSSAPSRLRSASYGAAGGVMLAPAVAIVSKYVVDRITGPIIRDRDDALAEQRQ